MINGAFLLPANAPNCSRIAGAAHFSWRICVLGDCCALKNALMPFMCFFFSLASQVSATTKKTVDFDFGRFTQIRCEMVVAQCEMRGVRLPRFCMGHLVSLTRWIIQLGQCGSYFWYKNITWMHWNISFNRKILDILLNHNPLFKEYNKIYTIYVRASKINVNINHDANKLHLSLATHIVYSTLKLCWMPQLRNLTATRPTLKLTATKIPSRVRRKT